MSTPNVPWEVIGFESTVAESGNPGMRIFCRRELISENSEGYEVNRFYYNPEKVDYQPRMGQLIWPIVENRYVTNVLVFS